MQKIANIHLAIYDLIVQHSSRIDVQLLDHPVNYQPLSSNELTELESMGGECVFLGRTRAENHATHGRLQRLNYEAYGPLAESVLHELASVAIERFGCTFVRIHHAICEVPAGQASVLVQTLCKHRDKAFESCRFLIDELKARAPIWKREEWQDGSTWSKGVPVSLLERRP